MAERDYRKRYKEIMRNAGERKRILTQRALERERLYRKRGEARISELERDKADAAIRVIERIELELAKLAGGNESVAGQVERIHLKAEIAHLRKLRDQLLGHRRRKPPESGISVPAVPPRGPLPKQGGAEAPLDFSAPKR
ncbi:hypothetical protein [Erythrobacter sp. THAF29]|uniref:hypothetical protein n=1 Tax=Erythrobacter sp. THAF29 TaxID=2587851 RepID=UPI0012696547|nr:hypothetical protein [Erythrobacter sp. THAF29]QFT76426.1 hypothetical protein FIU90_02605 [Erythrobacter sp. THAF29]